MVDKCVSGKRVFASEQIAEEVLIELWTKNNYADRHAPISVYRCDDCGFYHLTSREPVNEKLSQYLKSHKFQLNREAEKWNEKFKRR